MASSICVPKLYFIATVLLLHQKKPKLKLLSILFADQIAAGKCFFREAFIRSTKLINLCDAFDYGVLCSSSGIFN